MMNRRALFSVLWSLFLCLAGQAAPAALRVAVFQVDATPPFGAALCNGAVMPAKEIVTPLSARGVILLGTGRPVVLCTFDWVGIANESHQVFREELARAAGTTPERVALHTLHQHDAPGSDFATERLLAEHGLGGRYSNPEFDRDVIRRLAAAAAASLPQARPVTHVGLGSGVVEKVASNRRILDPLTQLVVLQRQSAGGKNLAAREAPEGTIDPQARLVAFWNGDQPVAALSYYATHPQSYYGQGGVSWDFVGMARELRERALPGVPLVHFNGAGGNVAAGKYNDGAKENRAVLAQRLAAGLQRAWDGQRKHAVTAADLGWEVAPVSLPIRATLVEEKLAARLKDPALKQADRLRAGRDLTFVRRTRGGHQVPVTCLQLGPARILHLPGELFVEYQLAAQQERPGEFVALAAYGDYGPGYIGTAVAYNQGGYETGIVSRVAPAVEAVLMGAIKDLLARPLGAGRSGGQED
ncbi:MAG: hypothetical protein JNL92_15485 [Opitutaceae bacterium]|nr:hypothetical protein [Opitutaceae bacterium]